jgi:hypothetical protein
MPRKAKDAATRRPSNYTATPIRGQRAYWAKFPESIEVTNEHGTFLVRYTRTAWRKIQESSGEVKKKRVIALMIHEGKEIGDMQLIGFNMAEHLENDEFIMIMDMESQSDLELAEVLTTQWEELKLDVIDHGPIVEFRDARINRSFPGRIPIWATIAEALLAKEFKSYSVLAMKAYPLNVADNEEQRPGISPEPRDPKFVKRREAMIRYYRNIFGVEPVRSPWGERGWLWRSNPGLRDAIR